MREAMSALVGRVLVAALALWLASVHTPAVAAAQVATVSGRVEGGALDGGAVIAFKGLPYAEPPVGERRWRAPQPAPRWAGVRRADAFGPACMQKRGISLENGGDPGPLGEDCLTLNVWTPRAAPDAKLPVMVWLHGGALIFGGGSLALYDGASLAERGAVVVTVNYRLGAFGFFAHPAMRRGEGGEGHVNFGLLDQIAALAWVRDNIAAFGGDPGNVTIFGQSAGGQSVLALYASPLARGLFHRGIAQSAYGVPSHSLAKASKVGIGIAKALGLPGERASAKDLRALPAEALAELDDKALTLAPSFVVGDAALPRPILATFRRGEQAALPLVVGSNSDDSSVVLAFGIEPKALIRRLGAARIAVGPLFPGVTDDAELGRQVARDLVFTAFARRVAYLHSARAPTWRYWFEALPEGLRGQRPGAAHGGEIPFVFGSADACGCTGAAPTDADREAAKRIGDRWVAFARDGRPQRAGDAEWPRDRRLAPVVMAFGDDAHEAEPEFMRRRLDSLIGALRLAERLVPPQYDTGAPVR